VLLFEQQAVEAVLAVIGVDEAGRERHVHRMDAGGTYVRFVRRPARAARTRLSS
jgi:hypothetical protein